MDRIINHTDETELMILRSHLKSLAGNVPGLSHEYVQKELVDMASRLDVIIKNIERRSR